MEVVAEAKLVLETAGVAAVTMTATVPHPRIALYPTTYHRKIAINKSGTFSIRVPLVLLIIQLYVTGYFLGT